MTDFTVDLLLKNKTIPGLSLLAGEKGRHQTITNVNIIDNPDTYDWLSSGDFLLTTGYIFKDDAQMQRKVIRELAEINCAGLGIKIKRYFDEIPQRMLDEAEKHGFPLVKIPFTYSLAQVSNLINNEIFKREDTLLQKSMKIHQIMTGCILNGGGIEKLAGTLCGLIDNPILIVDSNWGLLAFAEHEENPFPLRDFINLKPNEMPFRHSFLTGIPRNIEEFTKSIKRGYRCGEDTVMCRILPFAANKKIYGFLVAWESVSTMTNIDYVAMEATASAVAMERLKVRQIEEARLQMRQDFFDDLLQGKLQSVNAANHLAELYQINPHKSYVCLLIKLDFEGVGDGIDYVESRETLALGKKKVIAASDAILCAHKFSPVSIHRNNLILSFIMLREEDANERMDKLLAGAADEIYRMLQEEFGGWKTLIGVGTPCERFFDIKHTYFEAQEALRISQMVAPGTAVSFFDHYSVYHLLSAALDESMLERFYLDALGKLRDYDRENHTELVRTLEHYFLCNANISMAAKSLFIHRNTFIYRTEKIKAVLNTRLDDPEELLKLQIALHILKIIPKV